MKKSLRSSLTLTSFLIFISHAVDCNSPQSREEARHGPLSVERDDVPHVEEAGRTDDLPHGQLCVLAPLCSLYVSHADSGSISVLYHNIYHFTLMLSFNSLK